MKLSVMKWLAPIAVFTAAVGCGGSDSTGTQSSGLAGSYTAFQWVTTGGSGQTNQLAIGSTQFKVVYIRAGKFHKLLLANTVTGRNRWEERPAVLRRKK